MGEVGDEISHGRIHKVCQTQHKRTDIDGLVTVLAHVLYDGGVDLATLVRLLVQVLQLRADRESA